MTLIDVDRHSDDRGSPMPNVHDVLSAESVAAKATQGNQYSVNQPPSGRINVTNQRILTNDGTTNRLLITPTQIRVSQPGIDVTQATPAQLLLNSDQDIFKILLKGSDTVTISSASQVTHTIAHNLGYIPAVVAFAACTSDNFSSLSSQPSYTIGQYMPISSTLYTLQAVGSSGASVWQPIFIISALLDTNNLYLTYNQIWVTGGHTYAYAVNYYILQETAN